MENKLFFIFFIISCFTINAQSINLKSPLPEDETFIKGKLPNGLTYYIKSTDVVKDAASYYIIQNVGSILEDDDQRGLAHFLEHMAFNGTQSFPNKGILNTLQNHGAIFGKDINAYTSFDETVYNLSNIPTKQGLIDTCLTVLHDWSNYLLLTDNEIDAERGVIKEEWRTKQNGRMRLFQSSLPITFNKSKYAERLPIGLMSVVDNFEYKALRDFYHDWYRTDLQAIAIIGDVDVVEIEQKIKNKFSKIPAIKNPRERFVVNIPANNKMLYSLGTDSEISTTSLEFGIRHKKVQNLQTIAALKRSLLESMVISMLSARIYEKAQEPNAPFLGARVMFGNMVRTSNVFNININPKPNKQQQAFEAVLTEIVRASKFGFTQAEIERTIKKISTSYEARISKKDNQSHKAISQLIKDNYLDNKTITDLEKEYKLAKLLLSAFTTEEFNKTIQEFYAKHNRYLNVTGVKGENNLTEEEANQIINKVENDLNLTEYKDEFRAKTLISGINFKVGSIKEVQENKEIGAVSYTLSNGVKVHYKFSNKEKNKVDLNAISQGGLSLLDKADLPSAGLISNLIDMSGIGDFSAIELPKVLAGKTATVKLQLNETSEKFKGSSTTKDVETLLQLIHLRFVKPRFDEQAYKVLQGGVSNYLMRRSTDINEIMKDSLITTLYGKNHPRKRVFNKDFVNDISFERIKSVYEERFSNAADFEFYIVGDVTEEQLRPLLTKYLASIPTTHVKEKFKANAINWLNNKIDKDIYLKMKAPKASVRIAFENEIDYTIENELTVKALSDILKLRYTETLREEEGGTYSTGVRAILIKEPVPKVSLMIYFDSNPDKVDKLVSIVNEELKKISNGSINQQDVDKTLTSFLKERKQIKNKNSYDMELLTTFYQDGYNMDKAENFENIVNKITKSDVKKIAKLLVNKGKSYQIIFKPKK